MTEHEYDRKGRLVRSTTRREAEWDEEQAAWMLALADYRSKVHKDCGEYLPESAAASNENAYLASPPVRCHVCTERHRAYRAFVEGGGSGAEALLIPVHKRG